MPSTYTNDLRIEEQATGENSGTWGTKVNSAFSQIAEAFSYGTQDCFSSDADATTTVADGATDPARAMYFKVTSSATLTATRTLTIAPNTISRVMFIENATTGSQSIAISQGSGANVTIETGKTKIVYLDGAGATAAVVDAMAKVDPGVNDTLAEVLTAGNTSSGTNIELTTTDKVQFRDSAIYLNSSADGQLDIVADTEVQIATTTVDLNGALDVSGNTTIAGDAAITGGSSGSTVLTLTSNALADTPLMVFQRTGGAVAGKLAYEDSNTAISFGTTTAHELKLLTNNTNRLEIDSSGNSTFSGTVTSTGLTVSGDAVFTPDNDGVRITGANYATLRLEENDTTDLNTTLFNSSGDFVITTTNDARSTTVDRFRLDHSTGDIGFYNAAGSSQTLFWDASADSLGIGTTSPSTKLHLGGTAPGDSIIRQDSTSSGTNWEIGERAAGKWQIFEDDTDSIVATFMSAGNVGIGTESPSSYDSRANNLVVGDSGDAGITIFSGASNDARLQFAPSGDTGLNNGLIGYDNANDKMTFATAGSDRMEIDSSGNAIFTKSGGAYLQLKDASAVRGAINVGTSDGLIFTTGASFSERMRINSSGNVGINCSNPATKFVVQHTDGASGIEFSMGSTLNYLQSYNRSTSDYVALKIDAEDIRFGTNDGTERMRISSTGAVNIGGTTMDEKLNIQTGSTGEKAMIAFRNTQAGTQIGMPANVNALTFTTADTERMRITSDGDVQFPLATNAFGKFADNISEVGSGNLALQISNTGQTALKPFGIRADDIRFATASGERVRINNTALLVGTTTYDSNNAGVLAGIDGAFFATRDGDIPATFNRLTSDGQIIRLQRGGSDIGSIGSVASEIAIGSNDAYLWTSGNNNAFLPASTVTGGASNGLLDLGSSTRRFKDFYAGGNINHAVASGASGNSVIGAIVGVSNGYQITSDSSNNQEYRWHNATTQSMTLNSSGNLLVGTTSLGDVNSLSTNHLFEGASSTTGSGAVGVYNNTGTANCPALVVLNRDTSTDSSNRFVQFYANVTSSTAQNMGGIVGNGVDNVQFASISDVREKTNIQSISGSLTKINALRPVEFDWIASGEHVNAGFVAQEVEQVFPEFVVENMAEEGAEERKGLTGGMTGGIVAHLVKAIQEQQDLIESLTARISQLEGEN